MKKTLLIVLLLFGILFYAEGKRLSKSRGSSSRGSSRKTASNPQPTSISHAAPAQQSAPKPSLFGWQEASAQRKSSQPRQSQQPKQTQTQKHSYPESNSGMSGSGPARQPSPHQESVQKSSAPQLNNAGQQSPSRTGQQTNINQPSHSYPPSNGLSGGGAGYPQHQGAGGAAPPPYSAAGGTNYNQQQGHPPPYSNSGYQQGTGVAGGGYQHPAPPPPYGAHSGYGGYGGQGGYGGHGGYGGYGGQGVYGGHGGYNPVNTPQMPGYFGNYGSKGYGGVSRSRGILTGVGIAGAGVGTLLTGLALWNLARSTGNHHHTVIYDNSGQPVAVAPNNSTEPVVDPILGDLVNCTLTISSPNATEVLAIPCAIATSFTPEADVKEAGVSDNPNDNTKCTVTVVTKAGREFMTTIPCSILLNTAAENNVTEPPLINNGTEVSGPIPPPDQNVYVPPVFPPPSPTALPLSDSVKYANLNCTPEQGDVRDPLNPCLVVTSNLDVIPLESTITPPVA